MITTPTNQPGEDGAARNLSPGNVEVSRSFTSSFKESWKRFAASRSGRRFQERYAYRKSLRRKRARRLVRSNWLRKVELARFLYIGGGVILMLASAVGGWLPVLGWGTAFLGLGLIAGEFRPAARFMDWGEKRGRKVLTPVWHAFRNLPNWMQVVIPVVVALATFALVAKVFHVTFLGG